MYWNENIENGLNDFFLQKEFLFQFLYVLLGMVFVPLPYAISCLHQVSSWLCTIVKGFCTVGYGFCIIGFFVLLSLLFVTLDNIFVSLLNDFVFLRNDLCIIGGGLYGL